jgi:hypothetical protein
MAIRREHLWAESLPRAQGASRPTVNPTIGADVIADITSFRQKELQNHD